MAGNLTAMIASIFSGSAVTADPYFEYTTLLLPGNGTNGAQNNSFLDTGNPAEFTASITGTTMTVSAVASGTIKVGVRILGSGVSLNTTITAFVSGTSGGVGVYTVSTSQTVSSTTITSDGFPITRNGTPMTQGTFSPFSQTGWGNYFSGSNSVTSASLGTAIGTSDFSLEFFIYQTASAGIITALQLTMAGNNIYLQTNSGAARFLSDSGISAISGGTVNTNTWNHLVATRQGSTVRLFVNGVLVANTTSSTSFGTPTATIGGATTLYLASMRVCIGSVPTSYQTSSTTNGTTIFTPPTSLLTTSSQGATSADVKLLTCQSNRFIDISDSPKTLTTSGSPSVQAFSPFNPTASWSSATYGGSGYFDGSGDYLTAPSNAAFTLDSTGDFTVECWIYPTASLATSPVVIILSNVADYNSAFTNRWGLIASGSTLGWLNSNGGFGIQTSTLNLLNTWTHVAVVRSGSTITMYVNGVASGTQTTTQSYTTQSALGVGYVSGATAFPGYISNARVVKGTAVYTAAFTPPTAPLTAITNTSLLLNFTNAGIYDATSKNDLETVGNAQISTTQSKWGGSSMSFDGTGDYLRSPASPLFDFNTGDFTVEAWVYTSSAVAYATIIDKSIGSGGTTGWFLEWSSTRGIWFFYQGSSASAAYTVATGQWYHLAVSKSGSSLRLFVNGVQQGSTATVTADITSTYGVSVGASNGTPQYQLNGYIQDLRITKGYARYTANFTPPTAAFPTL